MELAQKMTNGNGADKVVVTAGIVTQGIVDEAVAVCGKGGTVVLTGLNKLSTNNVQVSGALLTLMKKSIKGSLFGDCNPTTDIPKLLGLYQSGDLKLDELITKHVHPRSGQPGLRRSARRQEHPRHHRPRLQLRGECGRKARIWPQIVGWGSSPYRKYGSSPRPSFAAISAPYDHTLVAPLFGKERS